MNQIIKMITDMMARRGFYKLTVTIQNGKIVMLKKEETIKPEGKTHE